MEKYELREGETIIEEYIDEAGTHITVFEDENNEIKYGWILELSPDLKGFIKTGAAEANKSEQDYLEALMHVAIEKAVEQDEIKKAIEEFSK